MISTGEGFCPTEVGAFCPKRYSSYMGEKESRPSLSRVRNQRHRSPFCQHCSSAPGHSCTQYCRCHVHGHWPGVFIQIVELRPRSQKRKENFVRGVTSEGGFCPFAENSGGSLTVVSSGQAADRRWHRRPDWMWHVICSQRQPTLVDVAKTKTKKLNKKVVYWTRLQ